MTTQVSSTAVSGLVFILLAAGCVGGGGKSGPTPNPTGPAPTTPAQPLGLAWGSPVDLRAVGYEPSLAVDSTGALFLTAHKDLTRPDTWPYLASWILVSTDNGTSWHAPASPGQAHQAYVGDEGDLAVDARDWLYYIDTYLADNHLHAWSQQGRTWQYSIPMQRSTGADDRPWIFAQANGTVHYLGNNGADQPGVRYLYYRSTNGGITFTPGTGLAGAGWAHGAAQSKGKYAFISQEVSGGSATDLTVMTTADEGITWSQPVKAGRRDGAPGDGFPLIATDTGGNPSLVWVDTKDGPTKGTRIFLSQSYDHGKTWTQSEITPFPAYIDHVTLAGGAPGVVAVAFYATTDLPLSASSKWHLYGGLAYGRVEDAASFDFGMADSKILYTGQDLHALHDFFEIVVGPDGALDVGYQTTLPSAGANQPYGDRHLWFVRGEPKT